MLTTSPPPTPIPDLASLLPTELDGVEAHTFPVAQDLLARLAARLGVPFGSVEAAYSSEHGARFIQMLAIRVPDVEAQDLLTAFPDIAYPPVADPPEVGADTLAGVDVVVVNHPDMAFRLGTFYGLVRGGALIVVETLQREAAEAAIEAMPG